MKRLLFFGALKTKYGQLSLYGQVTIRNKCINELPIELHLLMFTILQVVYLRATSRGACDYVNDGKSWAFPHGVCWFEHCSDIEVIDVPGDHFSLLRQDNHDMNFIVTALKMKLGAFGWSEAIRRDRAGQQNKMSANDGRC